MRILAAEASRSTSEVDVMRHIQRNGNALSGSEFIVQLIDEFEHTGAHRCIISEVLGLPLYSDLEELYCDEKYPIDIAKRIVSQIARGLEYLHHCAVVHGGTQLDIDICLSHRANHRSSSQDYTFPLTFNHLWSPQE